MDASALLPYLVVLPYLGPVALLGVIARKRPDLKSFAPKTGRRLSVIVPARNEEAIIERCIRSIQASNYSPLEILVVDDRSTDGTASIVEYLSHTDARVKLVRGAELPEGWYGKPWACVQGFRAASGDIICFTDADTTHEPALLAHAVGALEESGATLFTLMPAQICLSAAERLVLPQIFLLLFARFRPQALNQATDPRDAIANGQFIMMERQEYEKVGTHASVKHEVAEDLALAQEVLKDGGRIFMTYALDLMQTRMYTSWTHLKEGWSKNLHLGSQRVFPEEQKVLRAVIPRLVAVPFLFWLVPPLILLLELFGIHTGVAEPAVMAMEISALFWMIFVASIGIPFYWGLGYPIGAAASAYIAIRSSWRGGRKVEWKGRTYSAGAPTTDS